MSISQIVKDVVVCMDAYDIPHELEKYQMMYCVAHIENRYGKSEAMATLNTHLDNHYKLKETAPCMCEGYKE